MSDSRARRALARAAARLNAASDRAGLLPSLILMTDDDRLRDPLAAARALPRGSAVIARARDCRERAKLVRSLLDVARVRQLIVLVSDDPHLARSSGADGVHFPEKRGAEAFAWAARRPDWLITMSAHSLHAVGRAFVVGADAVLLSPVFSTKSHRDRTPLAPIRANVIARQSPGPLYALGGVDGRNAQRINGRLFVGLAAIGALEITPIEES
jgi:thiamine-phosphate pyrophosphorylase